MGEEPMAMVAASHTPADRAPAAVPPPAWGPLERTLFHFAFAYLVLCTLPFPLNHVWHLAELPQPIQSIAICGSQVERWYTGLWNRPVVWVGERVFGVTVAIRTSKDDTTYHYVKTFCHLVLAAAVAVVWTFFARNRTGYPRLDRGLRVYLRFALASWMIVYASFKVFKTQFPNPGLFRLQQPVGEMSPMSLMWTFMGASEGYTVFTGLIELLAGLLLTFRRTTLLGALASAAILSHVFVLNLCYNVPVKLFSFHLLLLAVFLTLPDLPRLANLFLLGRPAAAVADCRLFRQPWLDRTAATVRTALILAFAGLLLAGAYEVRHTSGDLRPRPPLYGIWAVEEFTVDGQDRPPLVTDATRWQQLIMDRPQFVSVRLMNQSRVGYDQTLDTDASRLTLKKFDDMAWKAEFTYAQPAPDELTLEGTLDGKRVPVRCRRTDESRFPLVGRGFRWINERPFIR
jgi:hypothetical protein